MRRLSVRAANRHGSRPITFHLSPFTSLITDPLITHYFPPSAVWNDRIIRVSRGVLPAGTWENVRTRPHPDLAAYVREYHGYFEHSSQPLRRNDMASCDVSITISFGTPYPLIVP